MVSADLPLTRDPQFEPLLYSSNYAALQEMSTRKAEAKRFFAELQWTERVCGIEALLAEKRFEDCVASIDKLKEDGITTSASPRIYTKFKGMVQQLASEMASCGTDDGGETVGVFAPWLARIGKPDNARQVLLISAEVELASELGALTAPGSEATPSTVNLMLNRTLQIFRQTYSVYSRISSSWSHNSSFSWLGLWGNQTIRIHGGRK